MASNIETRTPARRHFVLAVIAMPALVVGISLLALFVSPEGSIADEGGSHDHNWGGHAWSHAHVGWILAAFAVYFYRVRVERDPVRGLRRNPFAVLAWCAVVWGAAAFTVDGALTALVGDDTTWTHGFALQAALQFPFMLGAPLFGALGAIWYAVKNRRPSRRPVVA